MKNIKVILKSQQRFRNETQSVFTEEGIKIAFSAKGDKKEYNQLIQ